MLDTSHTEIHYLYLLHTKNTHSLFVTQLGTFIHNQRKNQALIIRNLKILISLQENF